MNKLKIVKSQQNLKNIREYRSEIEACVNEIITTLYMRASSGLLIMIAFNIIPFVHTICTKSAYKQTDNLLPIFNELFRFALY